MTERKNTLLYFGRLDQMNGMDLYSSANFLNRFDRVIVDMPFTMNGVVYQKNDNTASFFETLQQSNHKVWVRIDLTAWTTATEATAKAIEKMTIIRTWFTDFLVLPLLRGFYLDSFGFYHEFPGDASHLTRQMQNDMLTAAHRDHRRPVICRAFYPNDLTTLIGPPHGVEDGLALNPLILGRDPALTDGIMMLNPLFSNWSTETPTKNGSRIASLLQAARGAYNQFDQSNVFFTVNQQFNLVNSAIDNLLGLTVSSPIATLMVNFARFMRALGLGDIGASDWNDWGTTSNKAVDHSHFSPEVWDTTDCLEDYATSFYSKSNQYFIQKTPTATTYKWDNNFAFIGAA